ncbi:hypothetical protein Hamer_G001575 [Homarus americanus]|uniref:Uncharacterized protein n=1 Tax=Homarus americanus TaxID=6706 RepID=A0A8J5MQX5_HOMAM|nr:hypothetical protein Hamer_G001575 [Homarus americanus]
MALGLEQAKQEDHGSEEVQLCLVTPTPKVQCSGRKWTNALDGSDRCSIDFRGIEFLEEDICQNVIPSPKVPAVEVEFLGKESSMKNWPVDELTLLTEIMKNNIPWRQGNEETGTKVSFSTC